MAISFKADIAAGSKEVIRLYAEIEFFLCKGVIIDIADHEVRKELRGGCGGSIVITANGSFGAAVRSSSDAVVA